MCEELSKELFLFDSDEDGSFDEDEDIESNKLNTPKSTPSHVKTNSRTPLSGGSLTSRSLTGKSQRSVTTKVRKVSITSSKPRSTQPVTPTQAGQCTLKSKSPHQVVSSGTKFETPTRAAGGSESSLSLAGQNLFDMSSGHSSEADEVSSSDEDLGEVYY